MAELFQTLGIAEQEINLKISLKLKELLLNNGYEVILTRNDENNIADDDKKATTKQMKVSDLNNRVKIANESGANFMISIHLNKYTASKYWGWQTFYSKNSSEGERLAMLIQNSISEEIDRDNKRTELPIEGIKIVDKTTIPVVIVECGFLSNSEDLALLQTDEYQDKIANGILKGIMKY